MGFIKKIWKDRISEFPTRRSLTKTDGTSELVTVARSEGMISEEGDAFSAENMNDFENRVANGFNELNENLTFPDGTGFYPDEQDGQKGYNTSPNRGADTFFPFSADLNIIAGFGTNKELVIPKNIKKALAIFDGHGQTSDVSTWTITITSSKNQSEEVVHFNKVPDTYRVLYTAPFNFYSAVITNLHKDDTIKASVSMSYLIIY